MPNDPYQWRESVLSTRSLSYVSTAGGGLGLSHGSEQAHPPLSRNGSLFSNPTRKNTLTSLSGISEDSALLMDDNDTQPHPTGSHSYDSPIPASVAASPLFALPRELRTQIYTYLLSSPTPISWPSLPSPSPTPTPNPTRTLNLSPPLLRLSAAIHAEALPILYANTLSFAHPSDANMFRHALSSRSGAAGATRLQFRIRGHDARLWCAYFNSTSRERSLVGDYPRLRELDVRYRLMRWNALASPEANARAWLKDLRLCEVVDSVRKCVGEGGLRVWIQMRVGDGWDGRVWVETAGRVAREWEARKEDARGRDERAGEVGVGGLVRCFGVWIGVEVDNLREKGGDRGDYPAPWEAGF